LARPIYMILAMLMLGIVLVPLRVEI